MRAFMFLILLLILLFFKAYDTQTDPHPASDALEPVLMFTSEYYFRHTGCCCQAEDFHPRHSHYLVHSVPPGPL